MVRARNSGACACGESLPESEVIDHQRVVRKGLNRKKKIEFIMKAAKVSDIRKQDNSAKENCFDLVSILGNHMVWKLFGAWATPNTVHFQNPFLASSGRGPVGDMRVHLP
jgi:hypothetical protein